MLTRTALTSFGPTASFGLTASLALALGALSALVGCGHARTSPQLLGARELMAEARQGDAQRLEPDELLIAQRLLTRAETENDGSSAEAHYAYLAERRTRIAMTNARRTLVVRGVEQNEAAYHSELEGVAEARGEALSDSLAALAERGRTVERQERELATSDAALATEREARVDAESSAATALERLRQLASVRVEDTQTVITLSGEVLFESGRSELRPEARERLLAVADALRGTPDQLATVAGYTDSRGSEGHNRALSQARSERVLEFLLDAGVPGERLRAEGRGESDPIASNDSAEGRANNRRVEIILRPAATRISTAPSSAPAAR